MKYTRREIEQVAGADMMFFAADFGNGFALQNIGRLLKVGMRMCRGNLVALDIRLERNGPFWREADIRPDDGVRNLLIASF
jgi:hypothetical protein